VITAGLLAADGLSITDLLVEAGILESRTEAKKAVQGNAVSVNKVKISALDHAITRTDLLHGKYLMIENGKKNKYLVQIDG
jgi:tyrosyl-tRNA synthetase